MHAALDYLKLGSPPHYVYAIAVTLLLAEDLIARSPLKANSTIQLVFSLLGLLPGVGPALAKLGGKAVAS